MVGFILTAQPRAMPPSDELTRYSYTEYHMGIDARLVVYAKDQTTAEEACSAAFARIAALESAMSDYRKDSELTQLCRVAGGPPKQVSYDLFVVLRRAQEISARSQGAFDVTIGPLIQLWRKVRKSGELPDPSEIEAARALVGWKKMHLDTRRGTVQLDVPGMKLDLGGIAKGYAADEAQKVLRAHGIRRALVEMGGDIVVSGPPPNADGWTIRVPNAGHDSGPTDLHFTNRAISTSGDTEQFVVIGGVQYSHVVDPRTGQAITNRIQATVITSSGFLSDPLSKMLALLGREEGELVLRTYPGTKFFVRTLQR